MKRIKNLTVFEKGDIVIVTRMGSNASQFNDGSLPMNGVYSIDMWKDVTFEIGGSVELCSYDCDPDCWCAYLLLHNGREAGYVYNTAIELAPRVVELTLDEVAEKFGIPTSQLKIKK